MKKLIVWLKSVVWKMLWFLFQILTVFDDMIADMINNKKLNSTVTELFIRGRKIKISIVFIMQSYFKVPKDVRPNTTHFFSWKLRIKENFKKLLKIVCKILVLKTSLISTKYILLNHTLFWLMILRLHQIIL